MFESSLFHERYHRSRPSGNCTPFDIQDFPNEETEEFSQESQSTATVLNSREQYKLILPILLSIANIASSHGTTQFRSYLRDVKKIEDILRSGRNVFCIPERLGNNDDTAKMKNALKRLRFHPWLHL